MLFKNSKNIYFIYKKNDKCIINNKILQNINNNKKKKINFNYNIKFYNNIKIKLKKKKKKFLFLKKKGFTFTLIKNYINNNIYFYYNNILNFNNKKFFLGTIIHNILYILYKKYINKNLNKKNIKNIKINKKKILKKVFFKFYNKVDIKLDKKIFFKYKLINKYVSNFIFCDEKLLIKGNNIKIIYLEKKIKKKIFLNKKKNNFTYIKGKIDRIDLLNNKYRIIEYKTKFNFEKNKFFLNLNNNNIEDIFIYKKYNNILQLLFYNLILKKNKLYILTIYLPYKIKNNILYLKIKNNKIKNYNIIKIFKKKLYKKILEILNLKKKLLGKLYI
ncbi:MAG: PD-(D/E)XK nuclease family protein [Candidatus Shikimatogenerans bostrichidophilus]|nr:MAG: PD-(D/E)XK nuclease family protein [Candidatus Shikimatogenerans bostrichidophilus]